MGSYIPASVRMPFHSPAHLTFGRSHVDYCGMGRGMIKYVRKHFFYLVYGHGQDYDVCSVEAVVKVDHLMDQSQFAGKAAMVSGCVHSFHPDIQL
jgi:hypothetical protein